MSVYSNADKNVQEFHDSEEEFHSDSESDCVSVADVADVADVSDVADVTDVTDVGADAAEVADVRSEEVRSEENDDLCCAPCAPCADVQEDEEAVDAAEEVNENTGSVKHCEVDTLRYRRNCEDLVRPEERTCCQPCTWFWTGRCNQGAACKHCHCCSAKERERRQKLKFQLFRDLRVHSCVELKELMERRQLTSVVELWMKFQNPLPQHQSDLVSEMLGLGSTTGLAQRTESPSNISSPAHASPAQYYPWSKAAQAAAGEKWVPSRPRGKGNSAASNKGASSPSGSSPGAHWGQGGLHQWGQQEQWQAYAQAVLQQRQQQQWW